MRSLRFWFWRLGLCTVLAQASLRPAWAEIQFYEIRSERITLAPPSFPPTQPGLTLQGSVFATASIGGLTDTRSSGSTPKLSLSGNPTNPTLQTSSFSVSTQLPFVSGAPFASANASLNLLGSAILARNDPSHPRFNPNDPTRDLVIDSKKTTSLLLNSGANNATFVQGTARSRDPITFGTNGFGGIGLAVAAEVAVDFSFSGNGKVPPGAMYAAEGLIFPDVLTNPDEPFEPPFEPEALGVLAAPTGQTFFRLTIDQTGPTRQINFIPGNTNSPNFAFAYTDNGIPLSPTDIINRVQNYLILTSHEPTAPVKIFTATATLKIPLANVTLAGQDLLQGTLGVPEPATLVLGLTGSLFLVVLMRRSNPKACQESRARDRAVVNR